MQSHSYFSTCPYVLLMRCFITNNTFNITFVGKPIRSWRFRVQFSAPKPPALSSWRGFPVLSGKFRDIKSDQTKTTYSNLRRIRKTAKCEFGFVMSVLFAVRRSACNSDPTDRIFMKFEDFSENLSKKFKFHLHLTRLTVLLTQYCAGDKIEKNEMGWACGAYG